MPQIDLDFYELNDAMREKLERLTPLQQKFLSSYKFSYNQFDAKDNCRIDQAIFDKIDTLVLEENFFDESPAEAKCQRHTFKDEEAQSPTSVTVNVADLKMALSLHAELKAESQVKEIHHENLQALNAFSNNTDEHTPALTGGQLYTLICLAHRIDVCNHLLNETGITQKLFGAKRALYLNKLLTWRDDYAICLSVFLVNTDHLEVFYQGFFSCFLKSSPFVGFRRPVEFGCHETSLNIVKKFLPFVVNDDSERIRSVGSALQWLDHMGIATEERLSIINNNPDSAGLLNGIRWNKEIKSFDVIKKLAATLFDMLVPAIVERQNEMNASGRMVYSIVPDRSVSFAASLLSFWREAQQAEVEEHAVSAEAIPQISP